MREYLVERLISELGGDPYSDNMKDTPHRIWKAEHEIFQGYQPKITEQDFTTFSSEGYGGIVLVKGISINSTCEHHAMPFLGEAVIGYVPGEKIYGLSKLVRIANVYAQRFQTQERLTKNILDHIKGEISPQGIGVYITASHTCMTMRGVKESNARTVTMLFDGVMQSGSFHEEFLRSI